AMVSGHCFHSFLTQLLPLSGHGLTTAMTSTFVTFAPCAGNSHPTSRSSGTYAYRGTTYWGLNMMTLSLCCPCPAMHASNKSFPELQCSVDQSYLHQLLWLCQLLHHLH